MTKRVQDYFFAKDVVPQPIFSPANSPLCLAGFEPDELLDVMLPAVVVRVFLKNCQKGLERFYECRISF